jgi:lipopolysaccharide export system protein LptA
MLSHTRNPKGHVAAVIACAAFAFAPQVAGKAAAQSAVSGVPNAMQGFSQNRDQPIQIESVSLEMRDKKKEATFTGNVKVIQGDTTMTSKVLVVYYESSNQNAQPATPAPVPAKAATKSGQSAPMQSAKGDVIVTQKDQVVTGETAVFDTKTNLITMMGGVVLTQGKNVLKGDRLLVDMTTGVSRVESDSGRVQGLFVSSGQTGTGPAQPGAPSAGSQPGAPQSLAPNKPK